jgi:hypothetical protein
MYNSLPAYVARLSESRGLSRYFSGRCCSLISWRSFFFHIKLTFHPRVRNHFYGRQETRFKTSASTPIREILIVCDVKMLTGHAVNILLLFLQINMHGIFSFFFSGKIFRRIYFLFSCHSINANTAGTIHPKMLNQTGTITPSKY